MLQAPESTAPAWRDRGHRVTERDDDDVGGGAHEQPVAAGVDARGRNGGRRRGRPPRAACATARQGIETSRARGAPDTSGAVTSVTESRRHPVPCGQAMVAVVCLTGSSGTKPHSSTPDDARDDRRSVDWSGAGTRVKGMRRRCDALPASTRRRCLMVAAAPGSTVRCAWPNRDRAAPAAAFG